MSEELIQRNLIEAPEKWAIGIITISAQPP